MPPHLCHPQVRSTAWIGVKLEIKYLPPPGFRKGGYGWRQRLINPWFILNTLSQTTTCPNRASRHLAPGRHDGGRPHPCIRGVFPLNPVEKSSVEIVLSGYMPICTQWNLWPLTVWVVVKGRSVLLLHAQDTTVGRLKMVTKSKFTSMRFHSV